MIYGNAVMLGGGGGGITATDAILRVQAPAGSTVTISKGAVSKTDLGHENAADNTVYDYYFIIHQSQFDSVNPWTVTATDGVETATDTVIIDAADEYDISFAKLILFKSGVGAVAGFASRRQGSNVTVTIGTDAISITVTNTSSTVISLYTSDTIDISKYSKAIFDVETVNAFDITTNWGLRFCVASNLNSVSLTGTSANLITPAYTMLPSTVGNRQLVTVDISAVTGEYYIGAWGASACKIYNIYLEK